MDDRTRRALAILDLIEADDSVDDTGRSAIGEALSSLRVRPTAAAEERGQIARDIMRRLFEMLEQPHDLDRHKLERALEVLNGVGELGARRASVAQHVAAAVESWRFRAIENRHDYEVARRLLNGLVLLDDGFGQLTEHFVVDTLTAEVKDARHLFDASDGWPRDACRVAAALSVECRAFGDECRPSDETNVRGRLTRVAELFRKALADGAHST